LGVKHLGSDNFLGNELKLERRQRLVDVADKNI
jgi:hypothetical protein